MSLRPNMESLLALLTIVLMALSSPSFAQPKMPKEAMETMGKTIDAVKLLEAYENDLTDGGEMPDAAKAAAALIAATKVAITQFEAYAKTSPPAKKGHIDTARTRLGWAVSHLEKFKMEKRAHVAVSLQEALFHIFISGIKIGPL